MDMHEEWASTPIDESRVSWGHKRGGKGQVAEPISARMPIGILPLLEIREKVPWWRGSSLYVTYRLSLSLSLSLSVLFTSPHVKGRRILRIYSWEILFFWRGEIYVLLRKYSPVGELLGTWWYIVNGMITNKDPVRVWREIGTDPTWRLEWISKNLQFTQQVEWMQSI